MPRDKLSKAIWKILRRLLDQEIALENMKKIGPWTILQPSKIRKHVGELKIVLYSLGGCVRARDRAVDCDYQCVVACVVASDNRATVALSRAKAVAAVAHLWTHLYTRVSFKKALDASFEPCHDLRFEVNFLEIMSGVRFTVWFIKHFAHYTRSCCR